MIVGFWTQGLEIFHRTGLTPGIQPDHADKLGRILSALDAAASPEDLRLPGFRLQTVKGENGGWSIWVAGEWRVTFSFGPSGIERVDYLAHVPGPDP